jgi:hypothetical protein
MNWTHGVTQFTSNLIYQNESGALNEAFSDIMGTSVEFFYQAVRGRANYLCSEDIATPAGSDRWRTRNPTATPITTPALHRHRRQRRRPHQSRASRTTLLPRDRGRHQPYLGLSVTGVGAANREQIEKVFYRAFTTMLTANATFAVARQATIQAARDLYGANSNAETRRHAGVDRRRRELNRPTVESVRAVVLPAAAGAGVEQLEIGLRRRMIRLQRHGALEGGARACDVSRVRQRSAENR